MRKNFLMSLLILLFVYLVNPVGAVSQDSLPLLFEKALVESREGNFIDALQSWDDFLLLYPEDAIALSNRGNVKLVLGDQPLVAIRWSDGRLRKTAGFYRRGLGAPHKQGCEIVLSKPLLGKLPQSATESTLCHEMIHAWIDLV